MAPRTDEQTREVEKLRVQIQSMEEEIRRLYQSRYQLDQATKQNEKLVATLQEAKGQIEALRVEVAERFFKHFILTRHLREAEACGF